MQLNPAPPGATIEIEVYVNSEPRWMTVPVFGWDEGGQPQVEGRHGDLVSAGLARNIYIPPRVLLLPGSGTLVLPDEADLPGERYPIIGWAIDDDGDLDGQPIIVYPDGSVGRKHTHDETTYISDEASE